MGPTVSSAQRHAAILLTSSPSSRSVVWPIHFLLFLSGVILAFVVLEVSYQMEMHTPPHVADDDNEELPPPNPVTGVFLTFGGRVTMSQLVLSTLRARLDALKPLLQLIV
eukprot:s1348_g13.t1